MSAKSEGIDPAKVRMCSGGDRVTARRLDRNLFTFLPEFKFTLKGRNIKPANWDTAKWRWTAHSNKNGLSYYDAASGEIRFRLRRRVAMIDHVFLHLVQHSHKSGEMINTKSDLSRVAGFAVGAVHDHIVDAVNISTGQAYFALGPNFVFRHSKYLSEVGVLLSSVTKAGGASSSARDGEGE